MAKLNVKVIGEVIEWKGEQYRKVEREAAVGDVVQANETMVDVTYGAYYEVTDVEDGEFSFTDDVGDSRDRSDKDEDFVVFEKLTEAVAEPAESSDLFTYENPDGTSVQYRKVKRKANVGERVLVTANTNSHAYKTGDVVVASGRYDWSGKMVGVETGAESGMIRDTDYVVLEPTGVTKSVASEPSYVQDGVTYRPTVAGEKPTHFVRKPDAPNRGWIKSGKVYEIVRFDGDGDYRFVGEGGNNNTSILRNSIGLVRVVEPKPARLTIGDYAKVVHDNCAHGCEVGTYVKIVVDDGKNMPYQAEKANGKRGGWMYPDDIIPATRAEFDAAVAELKKPARVPVGAYVKITNGDDLPNGSIAKVTADDNDSCPYRCALLDGSDYEYLTVDDLEVITEADAKAAIETETACKKWAAIGRKVNEYKTGDVVKVTRNCGAPVKIGGMYLLDRPHPESGGYVDGGWAVECELVTPVEQRFDSVC